MTLYKRKPKNWWERVWFKVRSSPVYHFEHNGAPIFYGNLYVKDKNKKEIYNLVGLISQEKFEANYEPVK